MPRQIILASLGEPPEDGAIGTVIESRSPDRGANTGKMLVRL